MEIEEMKELWSEMSDQLEQQKKLTNEIIMSMTQERYTKKFGVLLAYETLGAVICFLLAIYFLINFDRLDTWYLKVCGIFSLAFLFALPVLVLRAIRRIRSINIREKNYKETLISYTKAKTNLLRLQQVAIGASFLLMFAVAAVFSKLWSNKDFFTMERNIGSYLAFGVAILFVILVSRLGYGHYSRITHSAENLLKELE